LAITTNIDLLKQRRTKIIATLGPASEDIKTISRLLQAGVNIFRLNMSHGEHTMHARLVRNIRASIKATGISAAIMADLCGPKIRTGKFEKGKAELKRGSMVTMTVRQVQGNATLIPSQYRQLHQDVAPEQKILLNDGLITLEVVSIKDTEVTCRVIHGGIISDHKGINLPDSDVSAPAMTSKDRKDAIFSLRQGVDYLSLSFVRNADEINKLRRLIKRENSKAGIIAKIETPPALHNIDEILLASDAIMVARGDLGVELKPEEVPVAQLQLIDKARNTNRPVIVATQVLESMIEQARPTRAEISDISYAVTSGTDALMLSAESSVGKHPVSAVRTMDRAIRYTESYRWRSGMSAVTVSAARPSAPIIGITDRQDVHNKMQLMWGMIPCLVKRGVIKDANELARRKAMHYKLAKRGDYILLVQGFHANKKNNVPSVSVLQV